MYYFTFSFLRTSNWNINSFDTDKNSHWHAHTHEHVTIKGKYYHQPWRRYKVIQIKGDLQYIHLNVYKNSHTLTGSHMSTHPDKTHTLLYSAVISLEGPESALLPKRLVWKQNLSSPLILCSGACGRQQELFHFMFLWSFEFNVGCCLFISFFLFKKKKTSLTSGRFVQRRGSFSATPSSPLFQL